MSFAEYCIWPLFPSYKGRLRGIELYRAFIPTNLLKNRYPSMERQQLINTIRGLAEKIKTNGSEVDSLYQDAVALYETAVLLKHLPAEGEKPVAEIAKAAPLEAPKAEKQPVAAGSFDLFSEESSATPEPKETPLSSQAPKKEVLKEAPVKPARKRTDESVAEKQKHKKISDLKTAIGINEKFQFINELFDGNMKIGRAHV